MTGVTACVCHVLVLCFLFRHHSSVALFRLLPVRIVFSSRGCSLRGKWLHASDSEQLQFFSPERVHERHGWTNMQSESDLCLSLQGHLQLFADLIANTGGVAVDETFKAGIVCIGQLLLELFMHKHLGADI